MRDKTKTKQIGLPIGAATAVISPVVDLFNVWGQEAVSAGSFILMESGEYVLQEDNVSKIELE